MENQTPSGDETLYATIEVRGRPATFATAHEKPWKEAIRSAVAASSIEPRPRACFKVEIAFRTPVAQTTNDRWDLDNLVKPTLDALEGIFGLRAWKGTPQPNDDRVVELHATKRTIREGEDEGASIVVWVVADPDQR